MEQDNIVITDQFASDVMEGLNASPKKLLSKYFYDQEGDRLFQEIMKLDEYYLTRSEYEILKDNKNDILEIFRNESNAAGTFNLVELGAGDGYKTKVLLEYFIRSGADFQYRPVDISGNILHKLEDSLKREFPSLRVDGVENEYIAGLKELQHEETRNIILFLGSNIGNFTRQQALSFLKNMHNALQKGDILLVGVDLKKDPQVILDAYNDKKGITRQFNLNLLQRINRELKADFDLSSFKHFPVYDPVTGTTYSYLLSTKDQVVTILDIPVQFKQWEPVHMEISQKYSMEEVENLAASAGFEVVRSFQDKKGYFTDSIWRRV